MAPNGGPQAFQGDSRDLRGTYRVYNSSHSLQDPSFPFHFESDVPRDSPSLRDCTLPKMHYSQEPVRRGRN